MLDQDGRPPRGAIITIIIIITIIGGGRRLGGRGGLAQDGAQ